jgi:hypothetical protein
MSNSPSPQSFSTENIWQFPLSQREGLRTAYRPGGFIIGHHRLVRGVMVSPSPGSPSVETNWSSNASTLFSIGEESQESLGSQQSVPSPLGSLKYTSRVNTPVSNQRGEHIAHLCGETLRDNFFIFSYIAFRTIQSPSPSQLSGAGCMTSFFVDTPCT